METSETNANHKKKTKSRKRQKNQTNPTTTIHNTGTVNLSCILEEDNNGAVQLATDDNSVNISDVHSMNSGTTSSSSDDSTHCDMNETTYVPINVNEDTDVFIHPPIEDNTAEVEDEGDKPYLGNEWKWNSWETHNIQTDIPGPE